MMELNARQEALLRRVDELYRESAFQPPTPTEASRILGAPPSAIHAMLELAMQRGVVVRVTDTMLFHRDTVQRAKDLLAIEARAGVSPSRFRDMISASRKYAVPLLEYLDATGFTVRRGVLHALAGDRADAPAEEPRSAP
ncbi:MAG: hypothetical protein FJX72_07275 [Armatimonadetes bacterium]|nr:hypothetical protein [Armatimonadota bacterium]